MHLKNHVREAFIESAGDCELLFYSNPLPVVIFDVKSLEILDVNEMTNKLYGYSREEILNMTIKEIRPPVELPLVIETYKNHEFDTGIRNLGILNHVKKNGEPIKVEVIGHSIEYKKRNCMIVVCKDVTDKTNALRDLQISNERFEYVTKATNDVIWDWNLVTNQVYYSDNIRNLFGHSSGINNDNLPFYYEHVHPDDRERVVLYPDQVRYGTMINWKEEYRFKKADGEYAFVLDKGIVIRDENGVGIRMIGAMQDITGVKQKETQITHQNEQLMEIAQINAHEIRRPVATILGLIQLFKKENIVDDSHLELLEHLETTTQELDKVIRRIIDKTVA